MKHGFKKTRRLSSTLVRGGVAVQQPVWMFPDRFPAFPYPCFIRVNPWQKIRRAAPRQEQIQAEEISATDGHG
jgi:hypothetical protein